MRRLVTVGGEAGDAGGQRGLVAVAAGREGDIDGSAVFLVFMTLIIGGPGSAGWRGVSTEELAR